MILLICCKYSHFRRHTQYYYHFYAIYIVSYAQNTLHVHNINKKRFRNQASHKYLTSEIL